MIKLQAPFNCTSCTHDGNIYKTNKKGVIIVPHEAIHDLVKFHGFKHLIDNDDSAVEEKPEVIKKGEKLDKVEKPKDIKKDELDELDDDAQGDLL